MRNFILGTLAVIGMFISLLGSGIIGDIVKLLKISDFLDFDSWILMLIGSIISLVSIFFMEENNGKDL